jgi:branched-subunit amino acid transport protein
VSTTWAAVLIVGAVTIGLKSAGTLILQGREIPARLNGMIELLAPVMLAALVVTNTFGGDHKLVLDPRAAGLVAAAVSLLFRAPLLVTVVVAAVTAALIRAI